MRTYCCRSDLSDSFQNTTFSHPHDDLGFFDVLVPRGSAQGVLKRVAARLVCRHTPVAAKSAKPDKKKKRVVNRASIQIEKNILASRSGGIDPCWKKTKTKTKTTYHVRFKRLPIFLVSRNPVHLRPVFIRVPGIYLVPWYQVVVIAQGTAVVFHRDYKIVCPREVVVYHYYCTRSSPWCTDGLYRCV